MLVVPVRLWHDAHLWEPGLARVTERGFFTQSASAAGKHERGLIQPCWQIFYAPKPWGGRGFGVCSEVSLLALEAAMVASTATQQAQRDLFDARLTSNALITKPVLVCSTKVCTARPLIPPFIDSEGAALMRVQLDWALDHELVNVTQEGRACTASCARGAYLQQAWDRHYGWFPTPQCDCGAFFETFSSEDAEEAFKLVLMWREPEMRAEIEKLKTMQFGDRCLLDPRKMTLRGRSNTSERKRSHG